MKKTIFAIVFVFVAGIGVNASVASAATADVKGVDCFNEKQGETKECVLSVLNRTYQEEDPIGYVAYVNAKCPTIVIKSFENDTYVVAKFLKKNNNSTMPGLWNEVHKKYLGFSQYLTEGSRKLRIGYRSVNLRILQTDLESVAAAEAYETSCADYRNR